MAEQPTPLARRLAGWIRATGPLTVAQYMAACLGDPDYGYYRHRDPLGRGGDFITAPEISQLFGELIGIWCVATWQALGQPARFNLVELGPGRGTLMSDLLRAASIRPRFGEAASIHLVDTSPHLRAIQREKLARLDIVPVWHDAIDRLPREPTIFVANEFFDALPIRQFIKTETGWAERVVGLDGEDRLAFGLFPLNDPALPPGAPLGAVCEINPAAEAVADEIGNRLAEHPGAALIVDYGYGEPGYGDTLQAVRGHAFDEPLAHPGEADLSAHVDFRSLAAAGRRAGADSKPLMTQRDFLVSLGLEQRTDALSEGRDKESERAVRSAAARLTSAREMGNLFKVLGLATPGVNLPVFDRA